MHLRDAFGETALFAAVRGGSAAKAGAVGGARCFDFASCSSTFVLTNVL